MSRNIPAEPTENLKHEQFIEVFDKETKIYHKYAEVLNWIFEKVLKNYAPLSILKVRVKELPSFIGKIKRKAENNRGYSNPFEEITDFCGARIITQTQSESSDICKYIEDNFKINWDKSEDVMSRLKANEFGYRSIHYIISLTDEVIKIVKKHSEIQLTDKEIELLQTKEVEVQVRTILEHAWADIFHDRSYKSDFKIPEELDREIGRLSAILENADNDFSVLVHKLDALRNNYTVYMESTVRENKIKDLRSIINSLEKVNCNTMTEALNAAKLAKSLCKWNVVIELLKKYEHYYKKFDNLLENSLVVSEILIELGYAYCMASSKKPSSPNFRRGLKIITSVIDHGKYVTSGDKKIKVKAYIAMGWVKKYQKDSDALTCFQNAFRLEPGDPYLLANSISKKEDVNEIVKASIVKAIKTCEVHIKSKLELPQSFLTKGRLHLLLGDYTESLKTYIAAVDYCNDQNKDDGTQMIKKEINVIQDKARQEQFKEQKEFYHQFFNNEVSFIRTIYPWMDGYRDTPQEIYWICNVLNIARLVLFNDKNAFDKLTRSPGYKKEWFTGNMVIVSGGSKEDLENKRTTNENLIKIEGEKIEKNLEHYYEFLKETFRNYKGKVFYRGIKTGIHGLLGKAIDELKEKTSNITLVGYLPKPALVNGIECDGANCKLNKINDEKSGVSIQRWVDIITTLYEPNAKWFRRKDQLLSDILVIGINGRDTSAVEYRLALALGARVAVVKDSQGAAEEILKDHQFNQHPRLLAMPKNCMALRALISIIIMKENIDLDEQQEEIAREIYAMDIEAKQDCDPAAQSAWDNLDATFKYYYRHKVHYFVETLSLLNYGLQRTEDSQASFDFPRKDKMMMAKIEHGRFCAERLLLGWRFGEEWDAENKKSPDITEWEELTKDKRNRKHERQVKNVEEMVKLICERGYKIIELE